MFFLYVLIIPLLWVGRSFCQPDSLWAQKYTNDDHPISLYGLTMTSRGEYLLLGDLSNIYDPGPAGVALLADSAGNELWRERYGGGGTGEFLDDGAILPSGELLLVGSLKGEFQGKMYGYVPYALVIDSTGEELWSNVWPDGWEFHSVWISPDGGFIAAGIGHWDMFIVLVDSDYNTVWEKTIGFADANESCSDVIQTGDGGFAAAGMFSDNGNTDIMFVKLDAEGNEQWTKYYGGEDQESGAIIFPQSDGGYVLAGNTKSYGAGGWDEWLIRIDSEGDSIWSRAYGSDGNDIAENTRITADSGYVSAGYSYDINHPDGNWIDGPFILRIDKDGEILWQRAFKTRTSIQFHNIGASPDGGFAMVGYGGTDSWLFKTGRDPNHPNEAPRDFDLVSPEDSIRLNAGQDVTFSWTCPFDPDKDTLQYNLAFRFPFGPDSVVFHLSAQDTSLTYSRMDSLLSYLYGNPNEPDAFVDITWWAEASDGEFTTPSTSRRTLSSMIPFGVAGEGHPPVRFSLLPAFPNPFNSSTTARYLLPAPGLVVWSVIDESGRLVQQYPARFVAPGEHTLIVNAASWPSGVYLIRLETGHNLQIQRIAKIR